MSFPKIHAIKRLSWGDYRHTDFICGYSRKGNCWNAAHLDEFKRRLLDSRKSTLCEKCIKRYEVIANEND